ncbi:hypothetical protein QTP70_008733 [Hemibagrus guttatus]|uniref:Uncharacterized protein n=1 Tax=Hemibagrus guttatus TaxID=175788 RepID=A0AAE0VDV4_9TELE|nr:hypothetical protein QTP70_008733 [Hemibagrus guttatus]
MDEDIQHTFSTQQKATKLFHSIRFKFTLLGIVLLLATAAHPTGDLFGALDFPFRASYKFHSGCFASNISEMKEGYPSDIIYMSFKRKAGVNNHTKIFYCCT